MSMRSLMVHSCRIDRAIPGLADRYGHTEKSWPAGETVRCLIQDVRGQEIEGPQLGGQIVADVRVYLELPVVLAEQDRITDVTAGHKDDEYDVQFVQTWDYGTAPHHEVFAKAIATGEVS